jgi:hypothetical protein
MDRPNTNRKGWARWTPSASRGFRSGDDARRGRAVQRADPELSGGTELVADRHWQPRKGGGRISRPPPLFGCPAGSPRDSRYPGQPGSPRFPPGARPCRLASRAR